MIFTHFLSSPFSLLHPSKKGDYIFFPVFFPLCFLSSHFLSSSIFLSSKQTLRWNPTRKLNLGFLANLNPLLQIYNNWISRKDYWSLKITKISYIWLNILVASQFIIVVSWCHILNNDKGLIEFHAQCPTDFFCFDGLRISPYFPYYQTKI